MKYKSVSIWLLIGCLMILVQIVLGGITRLTDSGLSITEWEVVKGTLPPLNEADWALTFDKYKVAASKQYESLHANMSLSQFKKIYFWEYFHRLWARSMGFVFIIPFFYFLFRKKLSKSLLKKLGVVIFLASLSAIFGWIMVASGLNNDKRTWVNAYNLLIHLVLATSLFAFMIHTFYSYAYPTCKKFLWSNFYYFKLLGVLLFVQIGFGALMAGMKAALIFPYPFIVLESRVFIDIFSQMTPLSELNWYDYEPNNTLKIFVQLFHRATAWGLVFVSILFLKENYTFILKRYSVTIFFGLIGVQIVLGLLTVSYSIGHIPLILGVLHQLMAFIVLSSYLWIYHRAVK